MVQKVSESFKFHCTVNSLSVHYLPKMLQNIEKATCKVHLSGLIQDYSRLHCISYSTLHVGKMVTRFRWARQCKIQGLYKDYIGFHTVFKV